MVTGLGFYRISSKTSQIKMSITKIQCEKERIAPITNGFLVYIKILKEYLFRRQL